VREVVVVSREEGVWFLVWSACCAVRLWGTGYVLTSSTMKCRSCCPPSSWSPTPLNLILLPFFRPGLIGISRILSVKMRLPLSSNSLRLIFIFFLTPWNMSSSEMGSGFSTVVTSGVFSRLDVWKSSS
jgi:hypothetical protein